jgi:hypothetical protein
LLFGVVLYNEIIVLPFLGYNLYTKRAIRDREMIVDEERRQLSILNVNQTIDSEIMQTKESSHKDD